MHKALLCSFAVLLVSGCAAVATSRGPAARMVFADTSLQGQALDRLILDTGASHSFFVKEAATRRNLASERVPDARINVDGALELTPPAEIAIGAERFVLPLALSSFGDGFAADIDGGIGWAEVRDNILFFDGANRTVRVLDAVPAPALAWTRLKVLPRDQLFLEWPGAEGRPLILFVDTGSPFGVLLSQPQWGVFRAAHTGAIRKVRTAVAGAPTKVTEIGWAERLDLGGVSFHGVPVGEYHTFLKEPGDGELGIHALARLELIVDARAGVAYVRPLPPEAGRAAGARAPDPLRWGRVDWTIDSRLRVNVRTLRAYTAGAEGAIKAGRGDHAGAIADYGRALEADPSGVVNLAKRAISLLQLQRFEEAARDLQRAMELEPRNGTLLYLKASLWASLGDVDQALADYRGALELDPKLPEFPELKSAGAALERARALRASRPSPTP